jgi:hypothetical protein
MPAASSLLQATSERKPLVPAEREPRCSSQQAGSAPIHAPARGLRSTNTESARRRPPVRRSEADPGAATKQRVISGLRLGEPPIRTGSFGKTRKDLPEIDRRSHPLKTLRIVVLDEPKRLQRIHFVGIAVGGEQHPLIAARHPCCRRCRRRRLLPRSDASRRRRARPHPG